MCDTITYQTLSIIGLTLLHLLWCTKGFFSKLPTIEVTLQIWFTFPPLQVQICNTFWLLLILFVRSKQKFAVISLMLPDVVTGIQVCCSKLAKHCQIFILTPLAPNNNKSEPRIIGKEENVHWDWTPASRHHWEPSAGLTEVRTLPLNCHFWVVDPLQSKLERAHDSWVQCISSSVWKSSPVQFFDPLVP